MSLFCWQHRRAISLAAALQSDIEADPALKHHLDRCEACRVYRDEMRVLTGDLLHASAPKASPGFIGNLHERLVAPVRPPAWRNALVPALAVGLLVIGLTTWRVLSPRAQPDRIVFEPVPEKNTNAAQVYHPAPPGKVTVEPIIKINHVRRRMVVKTERIGKGRLHFAPANTQHEELPDTPVISRGEDARRWRECGLLLEAGGEARLAEAAYNASYRSHPTMQTAFEVGRSAEATGDTDRAVDIYADLLASTDARTNPEKGNNP